MYTIALCAGYGGLEIGLDAACEYVGWQSRVACYVEREAYAAALLARRMEAGALDSAPIWSDLATFDAADWRGAVDCITAGFPCQPHSNAGRRKGTADERWIWPDIRRIVRESGAWLVVLENVAGLLSSGGFDPVLRDLAEMGFAAEWLVLSAAAIGANHRRERVFIVAYGGLQYEQLQQRIDGAESAGVISSVANAARIRSGERSGRERIFDSGSSLDNSASAGRETGRASGIGLHVFDGGHSNVAYTGRVDSRRIQHELGPATSNACDGIGIGVADAIGDRRQWFANRGGLDMRRNMTRGVRLPEQVERYLRPGHPTSAGLPSSPNFLGSRRRLNPAFVGWLMGLPPLWTNIEHTNCDVQAMALYRSRLQRQLSNFFGASGSSLETPADAA